ncbi:MAG: hypothetical protein CSA35_03695 [Dethiosulfovibrio peptidovorans]|nr:MAG: hypothetical protein CSA35_03695 [Dethiosulfovibrio peptidovorans]
MANKRFSRRVLTALLVGVLVLGGSLLPRVAAWSDPVLPSILKNIPKEYTNPVVSNVLLLLDTSGSMAFSMLHGDRCWGDGSHPWKYRNLWQIYYGRDLNSSNNDIANPYNYYTPCTYRYLPQAGDPNGELHKTEQLVPNDSRMYALKKALWYIFTDPSLVEGLNVGVATYYQWKGPSRAHWYRGYPYGDSNKYFVSWSYDTSVRTARLRVPFGRIPPFQYNAGDFQLGVPDALTNSNQWYRLLSLIDGWENGNNPELRANGATPLASSIYRNDSNETATGYLKSQICYPCQQSWLIVLTDGQDSYTNHPEDAVQSAYNAYSSWTTPYGPVDEPIRTFVIGLTQSDSLMRTLHDMAYEGRAWEVDTTIPEHAAAFKASDTESLLQAFQSIFRTINKSGASSGAAPLVNTDKVNASGDVVYSLSCVPLSNGAWPGNLYKKRYIKKEATGPGATSGDYTYETIEIWDAEAGILAQGWENRVILYPQWTGSGGTPVSKNLSPFDATPASAQAIANAAGVPVSQDIAFVRWVRGGDWASSSTRPHPLLDAYKGGLLRLGPPPGIRSDSDFTQFAWDHRDRDTVIYSQGNDGIVHCFADQDGSELWGVVPPNVLHNGRMRRLIGSPGSENNGCSVYLLAGPIVAEDVKMTGTINSYRTILLGSLGYGGTGLYALDVTDPTKPGFLWARDSFVYDGNNFTATNSDLWWRGTTFGASLVQGPLVTSSNRLPDLRRVIGKPFIGWFGHQSAPSWVAFFGAGAGLKNPPEADGSITFLHSGDRGGRAVYAIRADDGSVDAAFTHSDMGEVLATPSVLAQTTLGKYLKIDTAYVGDSKGQVWCIVPEEIMPVRKVADLGIGGSSPPPLAQQVDLGRDVAGNLWIFGATGDDKELCVRGTTAPSNILFAFPDSEDKVMRRSDLEQLIGSGGTSKRKGWFLHLATNETVSARPKLHRGLYIAATFREDPTGNPCNPGVSRLYFMDAFSGEGKWTSNARYHEIPGIKITGIQATGNKIYLGVQNPTEKRVEKNDAVLQEQKTKTDPSGAVISMELPEVSGPASSSLLLRSLYWHRFH